MTRCRTSRTGRCRCWSELEQPYLRPVHPGVEPLPVAEEGGGRVAAPAQDPAPAVVQAGAVLQGPYRAVEPQHSDVLVARVQEIEVAAGCDAEAGGPGQPVEPQGAVCEAAARVAADARRHRRGPRRQVQHLDAVVARVRQEHQPVGVGRRVGQGPRLPEGGLDQQVGRPGPFGQSGDLGQVGLDVRDQEDPGWRLRQVRQVAAEVDQPRDGVDCGVGGVAHRVPPGSCVGPDLPPTSTSKCRECVAARKSWLPAPT